MSKAFYKFVGIPDAEIADSPYCGGYQHCHVTERTFCEHNVECQHCLADAESAMNDPDVAGLEVSHETPEPPCQGMGDHSAG